MSFYNTTNETGERLADYQHKAETQDEAILRVFRYADKVHPKGLTPSEAHELAGLKSPITSIRRAITNLTKDGKLQKTDDKREGPFGRPEYVWRLVENKAGEQLSLSLQ